VCCAHLQRFFKNFKNRSLFKLLSKICRTTFFKTTYRCIRNCIWKKSLTLSKKNQESPFRSKPPVKGLNELIFSENFVSILNRSEIFSGKSVFMLLVDLNGAAVATTVHPNIPSSNLIEHWHLSKIALMTQKFWVRKARFLLILMSFQWGALLKLI
jgi:hypothetical protein